MFSKDEEVPQYQKLLIQFSDWDTESSVWINSDAVADVKYICEY
jgi:hypothetical protein